MSATIEIATESTDELVHAMAVLIPQLSKSNPPPSRADLNAIISSEASVLFIARVNGKIAGALTLATFRIPTGVRAWIEDVVVDADARGHGVGEALNMAAIAEAAQGVEDVEIDEEVNVPTTDSGDDDTLSYFSKLASE